MRLHDPSAFDALDDIGTITTVDIGCKQNILPTHPQLELLREKVAMIGYKNLKITIGAEPISSLCTLLGRFVDAFTNNRYLRLDVSSSRLNFYGDLWAPCITNFMQHTPTLFLLDLGFLNSMPENLKDAIIRHRNLRELRLGHDRHPDTNHHDLHCAVAHVIARGNLTCLRVRLNVVDALPECYEEALKGGGSKLEILDIGLEPQSSVRLGLGTLTNWSNEDIETPQKLQHQMSGILCSHLSVKHIVQSNHRLHTFVRAERIDNAILRMAVRINNNYDNDYNNGDDLEMWKIRSKCFLCSGAMEEWMANLGNDMDDEDTNVKWLNKKLHVIQWLTRPDGFSGVVSFNWTYKFLKLHHSHLLSYCT